MSDSENLDYLQPDFDPRTLTVPRLRSILVTYGVQYPATAKKGQLIDIFLDEVAPRSAKILAERARAKRSSRGIVDVESSNSSSTDFMDDMVPPARNATRSRSPRKVSRRLQSEGPSDLDEPERRAPISPRKRSTRSTSRQLLSDADSDHDVPATKTPRAVSRHSFIDADGDVASKTPRAAPRRSVMDTDAEAAAKTPRAAPHRSVTPHVRLEPPTAEESDQFGYDGIGTASTRKPSPKVSSAVFTNDNPFQSGSSPPQALKTPSNRRRTTGGGGIDSVVSKAASTARRRTDGPVLEQPSRKISRSYEIPVSALKAPRTPEPPRMVEAGEEFTPDEQLELAQEEATHSAIARRQPPAKRAGVSLTTPVLVLLVTLLGAYAGWYRQEKVKVGYCGLGQPATQILPQDVQDKLPDWAILVLEPQCEACPTHAYCFDDFTVSCDDDYILKPHPLSLGGLVPLPPTCEPDGVKARRVQAIADKAVEELRNRRAKFECGDAADDEGKPVEAASIEEDALKEIVGEQRSKKLSKQEFDDLWAAALGEIQSRDEVEVETVQAGDSGGFPNTYLSSTSHASLPYACAAQLYVRRGLERYRFGIAAVAFSLVTLFASFQYARVSYRRRKAMAERVPRLVDVVLEKLANQKELAYEVGGEEDPFLFLPNLRDDVLRAEHKLKERERIWERVRVVVEQNSNVRQGQRESHNGEIGRAWEWIGPTAGGDGGRRRTLGGSRKSWGGASVRTDDDVAGSPGPRTPVSETPEGKSGLHRKWQEGTRAVF
ncbi:hypothetical protein RB596_006979 [Gaeumannomyces avenae]